MKNKNLMTALARIIAISVVMGLILIGTAVGEISRTGLVGEWHFDGDVKDSSGNGNDGVVNGAVFVEGKFGKALSFDEGDSIPLTNDLLTFPGSLELWMRTSSSNGVIFSMQNIGYPNSPPDYVPVLYIKNGQLSGEYGWYGKCDQIITPNTVNDGKWHHVVLAFDGTKDYMYFDGNLISSRQISTSKLGMIKQYIGVGFASGCWGLNGWTFFNGIIDEVRIYNRALSADEIKANYEAGQIIITASPSGAEVLVDGQSKGNASPTFTVSGIAPGSHGVKCKLSGYSDYDTNVALTSGSVASINCTLTPTPTPIPIPTSTPTPSPTPDLRLKGTPTPILSPNPQSNSLTVMLTSEPLSIVPGQTSSITVAVTGQDGKEISGADVMLSSIGGKFTPVSGTTNSFGQFTSTFTAPVEGKVVLKAKVRKEGFTEGSKELNIELNPTANQTSAPVLTSNPPIQDRGTNLWLIALVMFILIIAAILIYFVYIKKKQKVSVAETKKKEVMEKKKFCMFCHAPMPFDAEFCPKCGKKQDETKRFCMNCGALMPAVPELCGKCSKMPPSGEDTKTCKNCGEVIPIVAKFCSACGAGQPE